MRDQSVRGRVVAEDRDMGTAQFTVNGVSHGKIEKSKWKTGRQERRL